MKSLLIVYHSRTGGAHQMAEAAAASASNEPDVTVRRLSADGAGPADLLAADGVIFACPENLAAMSGAMKEFFDRCYYPVLDQLAGRPYAMMICAGSDGQGAVRQMTRIVTGWRMRAIADPVIICTHAQTPAAIQAPKRLTAGELGPCETLGAAFAAGLALGVF